MGHPFTDIVIPVHNALPDVKECLTTVVAGTSDYRLILVDDCSDRETHDYLYEFGLSHPSCIVVRTNRQRWFTRASNLGLKLVRTNPSVLMNSDCVVDPGWLEELFNVRDDFQQQNPQRRIGLVGSVLSAEEPRRYAEIREPGYVTGHCWLVNVDALFEISGARGMPGWYLDEVHPGAAHICSDRNACWEMNKLGFATLQSHKSGVGHKGGRSWGHNLALVTGMDPCLLGHEPIKENGNAEGKSAPVYYTRRTYTTLADLGQNPGQLSVIRAAAGHPDVVQGVLSEEQAQAAIANIRAANGGKVQTTGQALGTSYTRGKLMRHKPTGKTVTIIHASVGRKDGERVHEVVDGKTGKKFLARESNLKGIS